MTLRVKLQLWSIKESSLIQNDRYQRVNRLSLKLGNQYKATL